MKKITTLILLVGLLAGTASAAPITTAENNRLAYCITVGLRIFVHTGQEWKWNAEGPKYTTLRIEYAQITNPYDDPKIPFVPNDPFLRGQKLDRLMVTWKKLGFKRAVITNGHDTWEFNLPK
jgi:hypothetical protein